MDNMNYAAEFASSYNNLSSKIRDIIFLLLMSSFLAVPFFFSTYVFGNDDAFFIASLSIIHKNIFSGNFPVTWAQDLYCGYGSPIFLFWHFSILYIAEIFHILGFNLLNSLKITWILAILFSGISIYLFCIEFLSRKGAVLSALAFVYSPLFIDQIFVLHYLVILFSFSLFPLIYLSFFKLFSDNKIFYLITSSLLISLLAVFELFNATIFVPFLLIYLIVLSLRSNNPNKLFISLILILIGLGLSFWHLIPLYFDKKYVYLLKNPVIDEHLNIFTLISSLWRFKMSEFRLNMNGDPLGSLDYHLGVVQLFLTIISFFLYFKIKTISRHSLYLLLYFQLVLLISIFFIIPESHFFWKYFPLIHFIKSPDKFLGITVFAMAVLSGFSFDYLFNKSDKLINEIAFLIIISLILIFSLINLTPYYSTLNDDYFKTESIKNSCFKFTSHDHYLPIWVKELPQRPAAEPIFIKGSGKIVVKKSSDQKILFSIETNEPSQVQFDIFYYPGWRSYLNNHEIQLFPSEKHGLINFIVNPGSYEGTLLFKNTFARNVGFALTLISVCFLIIFCFLFKKSSL